MALRMAVKAASSRQGAGEGAKVVWHPARGCVRFKCACGRVLGWKHKSGGKRIPDEDRSEMCPCGVMHTR